jgi:hypothetical protein
MKKDLFDQVITDRQTILKALNMPKLLPENYLIESLIPIGKCIFIGEDQQTELSINNYFIIGKEYPVYFYNQFYFAIGKDGIGKKINKAWSKVKYIQYV